LRKTHSEDKVVRRRLTCTYLRNKVVGKFSLRKIGKFPKELMATLEREDPDPDWSNRGHGLVLTGKKSTLVRGGH
jgi:hypothetical protein